MDRSTDGHVLSLFEAYGIELEYMIVDRESLSVAPVADSLLEIADADDNHMTLVIEPLLDRVRRRSGSARS